MTARVAHRLLQAWPPLAIVAGELIALPCALASVAVLTRVLGPEGYAPIGIALAVWSWATLTMNSVFGSAGVLLVAGAGDRWRAAADTLTAMQLRLGLTACAVLLVLTPVMTSAIAVDGMGALLVVLALDLPGFALATALINVLLARGLLQPRALVSVVFWTTRTTLMIAAAASGLGALGVVVAVPLTSLVELAVLQRYVRPAWRVDSRVPPRALFTHSASFFTFAALMTLTERLGLLVLRPAGVDLGSIGWYAGALTLSSAPAVLTMFVSGLLLATISRARADGRHAHADDSARAGLTLLAWLGPGLAAAAAGAPLVVRVALGERFVPAAPLFAWLCLAAWGFGALWISAAILAAYGRVRWSVSLAALTLVGSAIGYALLVPAAGVLAAAHVTAMAAVVGGGLGVMLCSRVGLRPAWSSTRAVLRLFSDAT